MDTDTSMIKLVDEHFHYRGYHDREPRAVCRVRILEREHRPPIVILSELDENESTSVTNLIEQIAAEVIAKYLPHRWDAVGEDPAIVIEHFPPREHVRKAPTYDRVTFARWRPHLTWLGQELRIALSEPEWRHLSAEAVRHLLGEEADDLPEGEATGSSSS